MTKSVLASTQAEFSPPRNAGLAVLSPREREIAMLAARGLSNKEIAREVGTAEGTVKFQMHNALRKLGFKRRTDLILGGIAR